MSIRIEGGIPLNGKTNVSGSKNAILPLLAATLLVNGTVEFNNCPNISDVRNMTAILKKIGCGVEFIDDKIIVNTGGAESYTMPESLSREMRSSIFMLGPILTRFSKACCVYPGGCSIGNRPIDLHLKGLRKLNVEVIEENGHIFCDSSNIKAGTVNLDYPSVGATENIMMAAVAAKGVTTIVNAAREPEIVDLEKFMNKIGYKVNGAGTSVIRIEGEGEMCKSSVTVSHTVMPDRIVAGTIMCATAVTGGCVELNHVIPNHLEALSAKLSEAGCEIEYGQDSIKIKAPKKLSSMGSIETAPYPGFPTDMQAQIFAVAALCEGTTVITENVFESRFKHAPELIKMGAKVIQKDRVAVVNGVEGLNGARIVAHDLRGGAALIIAGMAANGETVVDGTEYIDRGYERIEDMFGALGAKITRM